MFTFQVKQKDNSKILSAFHLLIALILILDLLGVRIQEKKDWVFSAIYFISSVLLLILGIFSKKIFQNLSRHLPIFLYESALIFCGAIFFWSKGASLVSFSHGILAGAIVLFWIYFKRRINGEKIIISETHIILPGLSGDRLVTWNELTNVIKKFDLLTFDFKNNKLLQVQITDADTINENEFNEFCKQQLAVKNK